MPSVQLLPRNTLKFNFENHYPGAALEISLQRTIRVPDVPDSNTDFSLPPGLDKFEYVAVETLRDKLSADMVSKGGIVIPAWQAEAMWVNFTQNSVRYPFMLRIAAGGVNAISGKVWRNGPDLSEGHKTQDYLTVPPQRWLDGFKTEDGSVRQFVAAPLGKGVTVEEQLRGHAKFGGLQIVVHPLRKDYFERVVLPARERAAEVAATRAYMSSRSFGNDCLKMGMSDSKSLSMMGLAAGGRIAQRIEKDPYGPEHWDTTVSATLFVHMVNAEQWAALTGRPMPHKPLTAADYTRYGGKWFDYYAETDIPATSAFAKVQSLGQIAQNAGLPTDAPVVVPKQQVVDLTPKKVPQVATQWGKPGVK